MKQIDPRFFVEVSDDCKVMFDVFDIFHQLQTDKEMSEIDIED